MRRVRQGAKVVHFVPGARVISCKIFQIRPVPYDPTKRMFSADEHRFFDDTIGKMDVGRAGCFLIIFGIAPGTCDLSFIILPSLEDNAITELGNSFNSRFPGNAVLLGKERYAITEAKEHLFPIGATDESETFDLIRMNPLDGASFIFSQYLALQLQILSP